MCEKNGENKLDKYKCEKTLYSVGEKGSPLHMSSSTYCDISLKCKERGSRSIQKGSLRYKCMNCLDWDCCEFDLDQFTKNHNSTHVFLKLNFTVTGRISQVSGLNPLYSLQSLQGPFPCFSVSYILISFFRRAGKYKQAHIMLRSCSGSGGVPE